MPSCKQRTLLERLQQKFGHLPAWQKLTRDRDFEEMSPHLAFHYLQMLMWNLAHKAVPSRCCAITVHGMPSTRRNEHPPVESEGVRSGALV